MHDSDDDAVERMANYVLSHKSWKKIHTKFIDAQFQKHREFVGEISKTAKGKKTLKRLYGIKNIKGYSKVIS